MKRLCPRCDEIMMVRETPTLGLAICKRCGGLWLEAGSERTIEAALSQDADEATSIAAKRAAQEPVDEAAPAKCAVCRAEMHRYPVGPVEVDHCAEHGTWYDRAELVFVKQTLLAQGHRPPADAFNAPWDPDAPSGLELAREPTGRDRDAIAAELEIQRRDQELARFDGVQEKINEAARRESRQRVREERLERRLRYGEPTLLDVIWDVFD